MAQFGLSSNQLKLCSASMAESDNNCMLVGVAEMQRRQLAGRRNVCVYVDVRRRPAEFYSARCCLICRERRDKVSKSRLVWSGWTI